MDVGTKCISEHERSSRPDQTGRGRGQDEVSYPHTHQSRCDCDVHANQWEKPSHEDQGDIVTAESFPPARHRFFSTHFLCAPEFTQQMNAASPDKQV